MTTRHFQSATLFVCLLSLVVARIACSQQQVDPDPQAGAKPVNLQSAQEPEANTSEGTEALQKATQNPVASRISVVPAQNNANLALIPATALRMF
jgi:hypothetical protein